LYDDNNQRVEPLTDANDGMGKKRRQKDRRTELAKKWRQKYRTAKGGERLTVVIFLPTFFCLPSSRRPDGLTT